MEPKVHTIDAKGKKLGRIASQAAHLLMEKDSPHFAKHKKEGARVVIINAGKLSITEKRAADTTYLRYSGYPGALKEENLTSLRERRGIGEVVVRAVKGMIPRNKLRPAMLKRLEVKE